MENGTLALFAFGVAFTTIATWQMQGQIAAVRRRTATSRGKVVAVEFVDSHPGADGPCVGTYRAVVSFEAGGRAHRFRSVYGSSMHRPRVGSAVAIRFDPRDPDNAEVDRGQSVAMGRAVQVLFALSGVALLIAASVFDN
ncbi:MAG: DUF3592 domain-containing protein [Planctomycetes bacterium]|nr:DUF3592 domain-containing protein [Planctomycetota bacterium]